MTVSPWELWSVANMMISIHGAEAESQVEQRIAEMIAKQDEGGLIVWRAVKDKIAAMRAERPTKGTYVH